MEGLPLIPGYTFGDPTKSRFHLTHHFDFKNGYALRRRDCIGVGKSPIDVDSVAYLSECEPVKFDPVLTYGIIKRPSLPTFHPHFELYDKKCLNFKAFFKQSIFESPLEHYRVHHVNIIYFLEDDTILVSEPKVRNCGFLQGKIIRRAKIPKNTAGQYWHWKDFNLGIDVALYGFVFHIVDCDAYTKEYLTSQGIEVSDPEDLPPDPYNINRMILEKPITRVLPKKEDKLRRFLEYDGKILRLYGAWDERESAFGELKPCVIYYYLTDDSIEIQEVHDKNDGRDPFPLLLKKMKVPKNWNEWPVTFPSLCMEISEEEVTEYYSPKDFIIGNTVFILGRRILIYDCDPFTRDYYERILKIPLKEPIEVFEKPKPPPPRVYPPHIGFGSPEDSLQSCLSVIPKPPKLDVTRSILNANRILRYTAELDWVHPEDEGRQFQISYNLGTCKIAVFEPPIRNSGIIGGPFLKEILVPKPGTSTDFPEYYNPADFYIGAIVTFFKHRFKITGADLYVYRYMETNPDKFHPDALDNMRNYMVRQGYLKTDIEQCVAVQEERETQNQIIAPCKQETVA